MKRPLICLPLLLSALAAQSTQSIPFRAELSPLNEIPIVENLAATGKATVWMHVVRDAAGNLTSVAVDFGVRYSFPAAVTVTGLHIHRGSAAVNGPVVVDSGITAATATPDATGKTGITRQIVISNAEGLAVAREILAGSEGFYLNLHTTANPSGAIRGQLFPATATAVMTQLSSVNEVPVPQGVSATGTATIVALTARNKQNRVVSGEVLFDIRYTGFPASTNFTGLHIHTGAAGANGPVSIDSGLRGPVAADPSGAGFLQFVADIDPNTTAASAAIAGLANAPANYYVNLHTQANPAGAIRGQLTAPDIVSISVNATPAQEVPPVADSTARASAIFTLHSLRDAAGKVIAFTALFNVSPAFPAGTQFTGLHIHEAPAGQNGPVRIDSGLREAVTSATGTSNLYYLAPVTTAAGLTAVNALLANPAGFYLNLHTAATPSGAVRAQLGPAGTNTAILAPEISSVFGQRGGQDDGTAGLQSRFRIAGLRLAPLSGVSTGETLPSTLNGTSVMVGGFDAEIVSVSATSIIARLPSAVQLGPVPVRTLPVFVTAPNGRSNVGNLTVSNQPGDK
jgi:hypothetical protein